MKILRNTVRPATATADEVGERYAGLINCQVDVEFNDKIITVWGRRNDIYNTTEAYGFTGRYRTGNKAWPVSWDADDKREFDHVYFGNDSRAGTQHKSGISYNPKGFFKK